MENKIQNIMQFYTMCVKLKNTIRTGHLVCKLSCMNKKVVLI